MFLINKCNANNQLGLSVSLLSFKTALLFLSPAWISFIDESAEQNVFPDILMM